MTLTRRDTLRTLPATGLFTAPTQAKVFRVGIATTEFRAHSIERLVAELSGCGLRDVQLFFARIDGNRWQHGGRSSLPGLAPERAREIAGDYRSRSIEIHSLDCHTTLVHGERTECAAGLDYFEAAMKVCYHMSVRTFVTEAGHYAPEGPVPPVPCDSQAEVWNTAVATGRARAGSTEAHCAKVLLEPVHRSTQARAKRTRLSLEEFGSSRTRAPLDPANLLEWADSEEMLCQLRVWNGCVHAKDHTLHATAGVPEGKNRLDYAKLVRRAAEHTPAVPIITAYGESKTYRDGLAHLRATIQQTGIREA